ncbi:Uncharacterised protein [Plesiomonas shigelloides]|nr:Uncharacterised protein [Plesiomonas shigelloides]
MCLKSLLTFQKAYDVARHDAPNKAKQFGPSGPDVASLRRCLQR